MRESIAIGGGAPAGSETIPVSVKGRWVTAPVVRVNGQQIVIRGRWIKIAMLHDEDWVENEVFDPEACVRALRKRDGGARADIFCFSQKIPDIAPRYPHAMEMRSLAVAHVPSYEGWLSGLPCTTRQNIRRAGRRGAAIAVRGFDADVIQGICEVQNETPVRQGRLFPHYGKSYEQVRIDHGAFVDRSDFICATSGDEFIGFLKLVYRGGLASILQMVTKTAHYEKRTANGLLAKAAELCAERGISYLTYGEFNYGNKGDSSLREFKVRHGFSEMLTPRYYIPLTWWGELCVKARLYRGLHGFLPHGAITAGVNLRAKWYARRQRERNPGDRASGA